MRPGHAARIHGLSPGTAEFGRLPQVALRREKQRRGDAGHHHPRIRHGQRPLRRILQDDRRRRRLGRHRDRCGRLPAGGPLSVRHRGDRTLQRPDAVRLRRENPAGNDTRGRTFTVRTAATCAYAKEPLPQGTGSLYGIIDYFAGKYSLRITNREAEFSGTATSSAASPRTAGCPARTTQEFTAATPPTAYP